MKITWLTGTFAPAIINHLWQTTVVLAIIWAMTTVLQRNRASLRYQLWMLASIKFLVPFSLLVELGARFQFSTAKPIQAQRVSHLVTGAVEPYGQQQVFQHSRLHRREAMRSRTTGWP
jgi:beta-lactamase regulating signal transducer with metallopeptidase domain